MNRNELYEKLGDLIMKLDACKGVQSQQYYVKIRDIKKLLEAYDGK